MRKFPRALSQFQKIVSERGGRLRKIPFEELKSLGDVPVEHVTIESTPATIGVIVQNTPKGIRVVVQGFLKARLLGKHVALDGFYKHSDQTVTPMPQEELYQFD